MKFIQYRYSSLFHLLCVTLLIIVISFLVSIIYSTYRVDHEHIHQWNGVRILRINRFQGLNSVNQYLQNYYHVEGVEQISLNEKFHLMTLADAQRLKISRLRSIEQTLDSRTDCTHYRCLDVYKCETAENRLQIYIHPIRNLVNFTTNEPLVAEFSKEFYAILKAIRKSPFYTDDQSRACLYVIPIDTLNERIYQQYDVQKISSLLTEYAHFRRYNGSNHLFFNFIGGSNGKVNLKLGSAILASASLTTFTYRPTFDLKLPVYNPEYEQLLQSITLDQHIKQILNKPRKLMVVCLHCNLISKQHRNTLIEIQRKKSNQIISFFKCSNNSTLVHQPNDNGLTNHSKKYDDHLFCAHNSSPQTAKYEDILSSSTFCLIFRHKHLVQQTLLGDALMYGCIPIIVDDRFVAPFESKIDWKRFSVRMHEVQFSDVNSVLKSLGRSFGRLQAMRRNAVHVWAKFFSSIESIVETSLYLLNERMFPQTVITKQKWNQPDLDFDPLKCFSYEVGFQQSNCFEENAFDNQWNLIDARHLNDGQSHSFGFTAVILTYDRLESLLEVIAQVLSAPSLVKIVIVWNHQQKKPPEKAEFLRMISLQTHKPLRVSIDIVLMIENRLSNRFYPFKEIETDCILSIDDDITMLNGDELEFGFQIWREFSDRIVGFPSRVHRYDNLTRRWKYDSEWTNEMSLILTGAAFYHKYYHYLYTFALSPIIRDWVDEHMNCEDIAMNFLVSNVTKKAPLKVTPRKKFRCPECVGQPMISADAISHLNQRSYCVNYFAAVYGHMPLRYVEFRVDPLLYKDSLPEKLKKYNNIGNL